MASSTAAVCFLLAAHVAFAGALSLHRGQRSSAALSPGVTSGSWEPCWKESMCEAGDPCEFSGAGIICGLERDTQKQVIDRLPAESVVLEVGSRYGTVSCAIAKKQQHSGLRVSIEPDAAAFLDLNRNTEANKCKGVQVNGVVSSMNASLPHGGYYGINAAPTQGGDIKGFQPGELQALLSKKAGKDVSFSDLFIDCEGCGFKFIEEHTSLLSSNTLQRVFLEADINPWEDYESKFVPKMCEYGFDIEADELNTTCCPWIHHVVFKRGGKCEAASKAKASALAAMPSAAAPAAQDASLIHYSAWQ